MRGDLGSLYDAHADRLYAYCWSLVGDQLAAAAVRDTFSAAVHQPPRGDSVLWLYSLSRTVCADRGAFTGEVPAEGQTLFEGSDPLLRAAAGLRPDHREVLLLWAGEWLEPHDIARVLGIAPDTVMQLLATARTRLERAVLGILMRGATEPALDMISAFEKGRLPQLLARRAPAHAPGRLRDQVLAACEEEATRPLPSVAAPSPLVMIGQERPKRTPGGLSKGLGAAAGVAASAAAVIGLLISWPTAEGGDSASVAPSASEGQTHPASTRTSDAPQSPLPGLTGSQESADSSPSASGNPVTSAYGDSPRQAGGTTGGTAPAPPATSPAGKQSPAKKPVSDTPSRPEPPSTPAEQPSTTPPATTTPTTDPATPPDDGSTPPATTPTDPPSTPPADGSGTTSPSPTTNPAPEPGQG